MLHLFIIDFEKGFGSMSRKCIWNAVSNGKDIPKELITIIRTIYNGTKDHVLDRDKIPVGLA